MQKNLGKGFFGGEKETPAQAETQTASDVAERETETRMEEILSKVQGAGAVDVMLTYCRTEERTIAQDEVREESERDGKFRVEQKAVLTEEDENYTRPCQFEDVSLPGFRWSAMSVPLDGGRRLGICRLTIRDGDNAAPFILSENAPVIEGVVIVAEGGGDATVQAALHQAAEALCNVPAHKIAVLQMK